MANNPGTKSQGKKKDTTPTKRNQRSKKWNAKSNNNSNSISNDKLTRGRNHHSPMNNKLDTGFGHKLNVYTSSKTSDLDSHMHDRLLFLLANLYGRMVQVTVHNGTRFEGILQGTSTEGDLGIALAFARKLDGSSTLPGDKSKSSQYPVLPSLLIFAKDLMEISVVDADLTGGDGDDHYDETARLEQKKVFKIDTCISGKGENKERDLQKWNPELSDGYVLESLEDETKSSNGSVSWDQFAANETLFGLKTDFDEEIYTTRLDRSAPDYKDREKWAMEKANEIQNSETDNSHMLDECNMNSTHDDEMDEEDRYGAVIKTSEDNENVHVESILPKNQNQQDVDTMTLPADNLLHDLTSFSIHDSTKTKKMHGKKQASRRIVSQTATTFHEFAISEKNQLQQMEQQVLHKREKSLAFTLPSSLESDQLSTTTPTLSLPGNAAPTNMIRKETSNVKLYIKASEFKLNPVAAEFIPANRKLDKHLGESCIFGSAADGPLKIDGPVTTSDIFKIPLEKRHTQKPSTVEPIWSYGTKDYTHQFYHHKQYTEDVYSGYQNAIYCYEFPPYVYHQQYAPGLSVAPFQQQNGSYTNPQFVSNVPITVPSMPHVAYNPHISNGSSLDSSLANGIPPPFYQHVHNSSQVGSAPTRYTPDMMTHLAMIHQRPTVKHNSPGTTYYPSSSINRPPEKIGSSYRMGMAFKS